MIKQTKRLNVFSMKCVGFDTKLAELLMRECPKLLPETKQKRKKHSQTPESDCSQDSDSDFPRKRVHHLSPSLSDGGDSSSCQPSEPSDSEEEEASDCIPEEIE